ncbi:2,3-bisphosphoglycerate-independent phosphoglycerate mutase-like [Dorcoceras hygrometricum]|uniref:phosphoglycerate mutase (2,3-diphosphoglycerate-independent) n=1 Tax=Dorcoceras hygrometricum TaxID=472368 RepID=A0A2Z7A8Q1_9LAMI|nr:2,3-bisphosphoglycerate-independent phosphoglycerate mutase-like [Dorcoceras hygrometricum]
MFDFDVTEFSQSTSCHHLGSSGDRDIRIAGVVLYSGDPPKALIAKLVDLALESGKIYDGEGFKYIQESFDTGTLHLIGLLSDGGVHSRLDQLKLFLEGATEHGAKRIRVHVLTDGRDVLDGTSVGFVETLENFLAKLREKGIDARIASGGGRMFVTMDRYENHWNVVKRGWDAQVLGEARHKFKNAVEAVTKLQELPDTNDQNLLGLP